MAAQNDYEQMTKMGQIENQQGTFEISCVVRFSYQVKDVP